MIILDNNILIEIERENRNVIDKLLQLGKLYPETPATTAPIYAEFLEGFLLIGEPQRAEEYVKNFQILSFDKESAQLFARITIELVKKGQPIPLFDLMTASIAIAHNATVVSFDRHFEKVPGLKLILF